jgi:hypothetical protein
MNSTDVLQKTHKTRTTSNTNIPSETSVALPPIKRLREKRPVEDPEVSRESQGRRLAEARQKKGYRTASDAARLLGIAGPTYLAHENGTRQIRPDMAGFYGRMLSVSADWLLYGDGAMSRDASEPNPTATGRVESAPQPASEELGGLGRLLHALRVSRTADGSFSKLDGTSGKPGQLPPVSLTDGHVPELIQAHGDPSECLVTLHDGPDAGSLALREIWRIPTDMIERPRLFAMKLPSNTLLKDMPGGQRVFVDPDDVDADDEGLFIVGALPRGLLVPAYVRRTPRSDQLQVTRSVTKPPALISRGDIRILGRIVMQLRSFSEIEVQAIADAILAPAG